MDDMVYQCSNQNSIYVLNAGYNPSYGDFGTHAMHTQMTATGREMNGSRTTRTRNSIGASCSSAACSLQHKFKSFGTAAATAAAGASSSNGNSSAMPSSAAMAATATAAAIATTAATMATTIIAATAAPTAAAAATTPATAATTTTTTISTNYVNPVATSMSTAMCSPATAALQKLFNCSVGVGGGNVCQNVSHKNHQQQQQHQQQSNHNGSNNNCPVGSHNNSCLSATSSSPRSICDPHEGPAGAGAVGAGALPLLGSAMANKKKCTNVKSTLIAKKTKFLKFLEEEKWRSSNNVALLTADDAEACGAPLALLPSSNEAEPYTASTTSAMAATSSLATHSGIKHNNNNSSNSNSRDEATASAVGAEEQQNKLNNWSMHNDSNNKLTNYQQEQQQLELNKQTAKSSYELYQEAADILGLSCSLCDNCRCLDCQSGYFDCADDDDESYSEQSLMDEYDEYDYHGYGYEQQASLLTSAHHAGPNQPAMTQPDQHQLQQQQQQQQQQQLQAADLNLCYAVDCQQNCIRSDDGEPKEGTFQTDSEYESEPSTATKSEHRLAIDFDLINATSSQVLQNCATFNDLSLLDAERQVQPFT